MVPLVVTASPLGRTCGVARTPCSPRRWSGCRAVSLPVAVPGQEFSRRLRTFPPRHLNAQVAMRAPIQVTAANQLARPRARR
jgi:hypothetical protein